MQYQGQEPHEVIASAVKDMKRGYFGAARRKLEDWLFWNRKLSAKAKVDVVWAYRSTRVEEWNAAKSPNAKGCDRYGLYFDLSGNEAEGHCFLCGAETKYRYCCSEHSYEYWSSYNWKWASRAVCKRYDDGYHCGDCGHQGHHSDFEVHHIVPLDGEDRNWNVLNMASNLILLCRRCHIQRRVEWNYLMRRKDARGERSDNRQLLLPLMEV